MTVYINGTTGLSGVDGSASTPALQGADTNTGVRFGTDTVAIVTGGVDRVVTDSAGNVGIGTSSPGYKLDVSGTLRGRGDFYFGWVNGSQAGVWWSQTGYAVPAFQGLTSAGNVGDIVMQPGGGNLLIGTIGVTDGTTYRGATLSPTTNERTLLRLGTNTTASSSVALFYNPNGAVGAISTSASSTTYATSSDYRLKEDVQPMTGALAKNDLLNPVTYKWKVDGSDGQGFIAHELQAVFPDAVTGTKDAVDDEGNPQYQGVDTSFLVGHLVACVKELKSELDSVKAELATLKAGA